MYLDQAKKQEIFGQYGKSNTDTGSAESQIALFSYRISHLTEHLKKNRKDYTTARSLTQLVGKRRALLNYLYDRDINLSASVSNSHKETDPVYSTECTGFFCCICGGACFFSRLVPNYLR